jgi:hypothetical protein
VPTKETCERRAISRFCSTSAREWAGSRQLQAKAKSGTAQGGMRSLEPIEKIRNPERVLPPSPSRTDQVDLVVSLSSPVLPLITQDLQRSKHTCRANTFDVMQMAYLLAFCTTSDPALDFTAATCWPLVGYQRGCRWKALHYVLRPSHSSPRWTTTTPVAPR